MSDFYAQELSLKSMW